VTAALSIGVDFDNTIVCYDDLFHRAAREQALVPADLPPGKSAVRDYLRKAGREDAWTLLQGEVYGRRMLDAPPFAGVLAFFRRMVQGGVAVSIISHRSRHPYLGPRYDLHAAARDWLEHHGFVDAARIGLGRDRFFFEVHKHEKLARIASERCTHFIDDLPELLSEPAFPRGVERILFDPSDDYRHAPFQRLRSWGQIDQIVVGCHDKLLRS
jgi:hypothetical protein